MNRRHAVIYFARSEKTGLTKVGQSRHLPQRMKALSREEGPLQLLTTIRIVGGVDPYVAEGYAHALLREHLERAREWFRIDEAHIKNVCEKFDELGKHWQRSGQRKESTGEVALHAIQDLRYSFWIRDYRRERRLKALGIEFKSTLGANPMNVSERNRLERKALRTEQQRRRVETREALA